MSQLISIGKNSSGENQYLDLECIPLLICSYAYEYQLDQLFRQLSKLNLPDGSKIYMVTSERLFHRWGFSTNQFNPFFKDEPTKSAFNSWASLISTILKLIRKREKILKQRAGKVCMFEYRYLIIDNIWDIVTAKPKKLSFGLMLILLYGPLTGVHAIFASGISYRNLLELLINSHPKLRFKLQIKYGSIEPKSISSLGDELIYTPDDLIFYKKRGSLEMERFYG